MRYNKFLSFLCSLSILACSEDASNNADTSGQGGSMTRFAISNNHMYVADNQAIQVFDITGKTFEKIYEVTIGFGLETIFAKGEYLYLGANDAMYIYSIADPELPSFVFRYSHIISCDPVVVQGNRAYVTLRSGNFCNQAANALEIIDISNPYNPSLIRNYPMQQPHGLGVNDKYLFICEGEHGLKMFDVSDALNIQLIDHIADIHAYDVIARNNIVTVTGEDGIFQYLYPAQNSLKLLSKIEVNRAGL